MVKLVLRTTVSIALVLILSDWVYPVLLEHLAGDLYGRLTYISLYHPLVLRLLFISGCLALAGVVTVTVKFPAAKARDLRSKFKNALPCAVGLASFGLVWLHLVNRAKEALAHLGTIDIENIKITADVLPLHLLGFIPSAAVLIVYVCLKLNAKAMLPTK